MQDQKASAVDPTPGSPKGTLAFGPYRFDPSNGVLSSDGREFPLQPRVLRVLEHLLERPGEVVSKQELLDAAWADTVVAETSLIEAIKILRQALGDDPQQPTYVQTIHRRGYRFIAPVSAEAAIPRGETLPGRLSPGRRYRLIGLGTTAAAVLVVGTFLLWSWASREGLESSLAFEEPDWVLITAFENSTGETLFDGSLEHELGSELSSGFVNVVPRERIADTLRLMRKPADATVDGALGQEISVRDGGIRAVLTGRVEKLGSAYLLSAELVDPTRRLTVVSFSEEAQGHEQVLPAVGRLSSRVREALGEALPLIRESEMSLAEVTTSSLRALKLYTRADVLMTNESIQWRVAEELLEQAVREDPEFASAYILLAFVMHKHNRPKVDLLPYAQRALELSDQTGEREQYFIRGGYFAITGQHQKMIANYQALLQLDPDHYWANQNLYFYNRYVWLWGMESAYPYLLRTAQLRPDSFPHIWRTAAYLAIEMNRPSEAEPYVQRAADLLEIDPAAHRDHDAVLWVRLYPAHRRWIEGDLEGVLNELDRWQETLRSNTDFYHDRLSAELGKFYLGLGMLEAAEEVFRLRAEPQGRDRRLIEVEYYRMDEKEGAEYLKRLRDLGRNSFLGANRLARAGLLSEAREQPGYSAVVRDPQEVLNFRSHISRIANQQLTQGEVALAEGNVPEAIARLQDGLFGLRSSGNHTYFRSSESLANAWERQGNLDRAVRTLEDASRQKNRTYAYRPYGGGGASTSAKLYWMRVRLRLAQLYLKLDREAEAREIETELRELLRYADPDLWLLRQLQALEKETT